jgi:curved DNA-binding protein CbpA
MTTGPLIWNPFAVLGLPEWPDLDDETVDAAWQAIAAETHPGRPDGGNLARYTQATAAHHELSSPWGRSEAFADLLEQAQAGAYFTAYPGHYPSGYDPADDLPPPPSPWQAELGPVPLAEVVHLVAEIPARFRRGHPRRLAARAAVIAGLCLATLALVPGRPATGFALYALIGIFVLSAREDMAPPARPVRRISPDEKKRKEK